MKLRTILIPIFSGCLLILSGCGGGGGDSGGGSTTTTTGTGGSTGSGGTTTTTQTAVRLSGTVGMSTSGRPAPRYAARALAHKSGSTPTDQIIVIAVDANGNSFTTMSDRAGEFEFADGDGLLSGTAYALVFIDTSTLELIGSLTTGTGGAGMLSLAGDTVLEEVLINASTGGATIAGDVTVDGESSTAEIVDGDQLDGDGDGKITPNEITTAQVTAATTGGDSAVETMSVVSFFGDVNTYVIGHENDSFGWVNNLCHISNPSDPSYPAECMDSDFGNDPMIDMSNQTGDIELVVAAQVQGPNGDIVNASKRMEMTYYSKEIADPTHPLVGLVQNTWNNGYASGAQADINKDATAWGNIAGTTGEFYSPYGDADLGSPPSLSYDQQMGIWGWAEYRFVDVVNKKMVTGQKRKNAQGLIEIDWGGFALPLNLPLNTDVPLSESRTEDFGFGPITITMNQTLHVKLAKNSDGTPALVTESGAGGIDLPVIQISMTGIDWSVSDNVGVLFDSTSNISTLDPQFQQMAQNISDDTNGTQCFFIVAKYGAEGDDADQDCNTSSDWQQALADIQFGEIALDAAGAVSTVTNRTPAFITDNGQGMPESDTAATTFADAQQWIGYIVENANSLDHVFEPFNFDDSSGGGGFGGGDEFWSWIEWPHNGSPLTPQPFGTPTDPTETIFKMGDIPGDISVSRLHYMSTGAGGAQFYLDLRVHNPVNFTENSILSSPVSAAAVDSNTQSLVDTLTATTGEQVIDITANFGALPAAGSQLWTELWESFEDPDGDGLYEPYEASWMSVWVIMDVDSNGDGVIDPAEGRQEYPVDGYRVVNPTPVPVTP